MLDLVTVSLFLSRSIYFFFSLACCFFLFYFFYSHSLFSPQQETFQPVALFCFCFTCCIVTCESFSTWFVCRLLVDLCLLIWMDRFFFCCPASAMFVSFCLPPVALICCISLFSLVFNPLMFSQKLSTYFFLLAVSIAHSLKYADIFKATSITHLLRVMGRQLFIFMLGRVPPQHSFGMLCLVMYDWKTDDPLLMSLTCPCLMLSYFRRPEKNRLM